MKQKKRILNDIRDILKFYDLGHFDEYAAIERILYQVDEACQNCVYNCEDGGCGAPQGKTCHNGFRAFLDTEAD